jgi:uncharacterized protein (TIGR03067 family)
MSRTSRRRTTSIPSVTDPAVVPKLLEDCWDEPETVFVPPGSDLEVLQGAWVSIAGWRQAEMLISGSHLAVHFADGDIYLGSFSLDSSTHPRVMTVSIDEGPARHKGQQAQCIYEVVGDTLRWCTAGPGPSDPLTAFPDEDVRHCLCLKFRREHLNGKG